MKKRNLIIVLVLLTATVITYLFYGKENIVLEESVSYNREAFFRNIVDTLKWKDWWPVNQKKLQYGSNVYKIKKITSSTVFIDVYKQGALPVLKTELNIIPIIRDSFKLIWNGTFSKTLNPIERYKNKLIMDDIKPQLKMIMHSLIQFYSNRKNLYGYNIKRDIVRDSIYASYQKKSSLFPNDSLIYSIVELLQKHITQQNIVITGRPMVNINPIGNTGYTVDVALPIQKRIKEIGGIKNKRMPLYHNLVVADVYGGNNEVYKALRAVEYFINDNVDQSPAKYYFSLETDRRIEKDSLKWHTRVVYPVM